MSTSLLRFHLFRLFLAMVVGIVGALVTLAFRKTMGFFELLLLGHSGSLVQAAMALPPWRRALTPALGGLLGGFALVLARRVSSQQRQEYMEAVVVGDGLLEVRAGFLRALASLLVVASGGAVGREGAMISLSTIVTSWGGRFLLSTKDLHVAVACAAAAGLSAAYNVPLASSMFVSEILLGRLDLQTTGPLIVSAVASLLTVESIHGGEAFFVVSSQQTVPPPSVVLMLLIGLACGCLAPAFLWWLRSTRQAFRRLALPTPLVLCLGGLLVGLLSVLRPEVYGNGYSVIQRLLNDEYAWQVLASILFLKLLAVGATTGSGAPGGVFTPTLFVGAALGTLFWLGVGPAFPPSAPLATLCTLTGMAALLAGTTHAPVMASLMTVEMTSSASALPALLPACVLAATIARAIDPDTVYLEAMKHEPKGKSGFFTVF